MLYTSVVYAVDAETLINSLDPNASNVGTRNLILLDDSNSDVVDNKSAPSVDLEIPFDFNKSNPTLAGEKIIDTIAIALQSPKLQAYNFKIEGHTDASGNVNYNKTLSQKRAKSVLDGLVARGLASNKLIAIGLGSEKLVDTNDPKSSKNRRVRIVTIVDNSQ